MNIGVDIVENKRLKNKEKSFALKILTSKELIIYNNLQDYNKLTFLAGRFAAKEAIIKALNNNEFSNIQEIEILKNKNGAPICTKIKNYKIKVSISHEKNYTVAIATVSK